MMVLVPLVLVSLARIILPALDVSYILSPLPSFDHCQPLTDIVLYHVSLFYQYITVAGGRGCPGSTFCNTCGCGCVTDAGKSPVGGCCLADFNCATGLVCDKSNDLVTGSSGTYRCIPK